VHPILGLEKPRYSGSVVGDESPQKGEGESEPLSEPLERGSGFGELRAQVPAAIRDVSFPGAARGYDRRAVDAYVKEVNRVIAELEVSRSPDAAVRHALDRVGEQTKAILQQARESAEEIESAAREEANESIARASAEAEEIVASAQAARAEAEGIVAGARAEADDVLVRANAEGEKTLTRANAEAEKILARASAEAAEHLRRSEEEIAASREQAEARMRELRSETEAIWKERHELLDDIHAMTSRLQEVASGAAARVSTREPADEASPVAAVRVENQRTGIAARGENTGTPGSSSAAG
jgi:DivIVA domain-containing protein